MAKIWKKGALHCHTLWSDGSSLPEMAIKVYADAGYDFVCISDHNVFQDDGDVWLNVWHEAGPWPRALSQAEYERTRKLLPGSMIEKNVSYRTYVRLKTYEELKAEWNRPGEFLLIPGTEITTGGESFGEEGRIHAIHVNTFNLARGFPLPHGGTALELTRKILDLYNGAATPESCVMMNHPWWVAWDVDPRVLIQMPEIRLCEICNGGADIPEGWIYDREKYWDFVLAHRLANGDPVLYGTASDDAHYYDLEHSGQSGVYGTGWVMVNCAEGFTAENIVSAMRRGDFYSTCGVLLDDIDFDRRTNTLSVKAHAEPGVQYRIDFISTGKNFDRTVTMREYPYEPFYKSRLRPVIPPEVGRVVKSVDGPCAACTLGKDDLYIRAVVHSSLETALKCSFYPEKQCAWTQPFTMISPA